MNALTQFLESFLGPADHGKGSNRKFSCPFEGCAGKNSKLSGEKKLEVDVETVEEDGRMINYYHCWSCNSKGKSIFSLLKALNAPDHLFTELKEIVKYTEVRKPNSEGPSTVFNGRLPREFQSLAGKIPKADLKLRHAKAYVKKRGITEDDILKYNMGYCDTGYYGGRIIIPSYDAAGKLNFIIARTIYEDIKPKYQNPPDCSRDIIPFELFVNWEEPVILAEGGFDILSIKRNAIPLLDKVIQPELMKKLLSSKCKKVYLAIDSDAMKQVVKYAELLINEGKQVFIVDFDGYKDANQMGFELFTKQIQKATRLTIGKLMKMKLGL